VIIFALETSGHFNPVNKIWRSQIQSPITFKRDSGSVVIIPNNARLRERRKNMLLLIVPFKRVQFARARKKLMFKNK
jgi:hypothetical protein